MHRPPRIHRQTVACRRRCDPPGEGRNRLPAGQAEGDILRHRQRLEQREMLEHHANAERAGRIGVAHRNGHAVPEDLPFVRLLHAIDDLHERRLAGPVLAEQRMDLPRSNREVDTVIGHGYAETLADTTQRKTRRRESRRTCHSMSLPAHRAQVNH